MNAAPDVATLPATQDPSETVFDGILPGRYSLERAARDDGSPRVFSCRARRVSLDFMSIEGPVGGAVGERVKVWIAYLDVLNGSVSEAGDRVFSIRLHMPARARRQFAGKIAWVSRHVRDNLPDLRAGQRLPMPTLRPVIILGDGHVHDCFVIDASSTGAAISADLDVAPGTRLALGRIVGTVVRTIDTGFAMKFDDEQPAETLRGVLGWTPYARDMERPLTSLL